MKIIYDENSFGITQRSLKMLRDALASRVNNSIAVFEVPTSSLCCAFLILDRDANEAVFTGDGFRRDRSGEGGAGYKTAEVLFRLFGVDPEIWHRIDLDEAYQGKTEIITERLKTAIAGIFENFNVVFRRPVDSMPQYIR